MTIYCIRNCVGLFYTGYAWTPNFEQARFRFKLGTMRSLVTSWVKSHPNEPVPEILSWELTPGLAVVIDDSQRAKKAVESIKRGILKSQQKHNEYKLQDLRKQRERIDSELAKLTG